MSRRVRWVAMAVAVALPALGRAQQPLTSVAEARIAVATGRYAEGITYLEKVARADTAWVRAQAELSRAYATLSRYQSKEKDASITQPSGYSNLQTIINTNALGDLSTDGRNRRGLGDVPIGWNDTLDRRSRGYELEVVANLTRDWRLTFNYGLADASQTDAYRQTRAWVDAQTPTFKQILDDAGVQEMNPISWCLVLREASVFTTGATATGAAADTPHFSSSSFDSSAASITVRADSSSTILARSAILVLLDEFCCVGFDWLYAASPCLALAARTRAIWPPGAASTPAIRVAGV